MLVKWYWIALISAAWIALGIVYTYAYVKVADKYLPKRRKKNPNTHADQYAYIGFVVGLALIYLSWPIIVPIFGLIDVSWGWWALMAVDIVCFAIFMSQNFEDVFTKQNEELLEDMPKVFALLASTIVCALLLVFSPLLLLEANWW